MLKLYQGGLARNIVPAEFKVTFDIRVTPKDTDIKEFEKLVLSWIAEAEGDDADSGKITYRFEAVFILKYFKTKIHKV